MILLGRVRIILGLVVLLVPLAGCTSLVPPQRPSTSTTGSVQIASVVPAFVLQSVRLAKVELSRDGLVRTFDLEPGPNGFFGGATQLPAGDWQLTLSFYDSNGDLTHFAEELVRIRGNQETFLQIEAKPIESVFELLVDLTEFPDRHEAERVRVTFSSGSVLTLHPVEDQPYLHHGQRSLPAGDYEFHVAVYKETFYASDRLYQSPWESVRLETAKTTQLIWKPQLGDARVEAEVIDLPPTPTNLGCEHREGETWIVWGESLHPSVASVRIYARTDDFEPFKLIGEAAAIEQAWHYEKRKPGLDEWVLITNVDASGTESFRSESINLSSCDGEDLD